MANRRPILGRPVAATGTTDAFGMLGLTPSEAQAFSYIGEIRSLADALNDLDAHARVSTSDANLQTVIQHAIRIGSVWQLIDKHRGDWTADIGPDQTIKLSDLVVIALPTGRAAPVLTPEQREQETDGKIHQSHLVTWEPVGTGQTVPPPEERNGKLAFRYLRQPQRAMLVDYSVPHLSVCSRVFTQRERVNKAVEWVQGAIKGGTLAGKPRRAEGIEYVADCLRIHRAYVAGLNAQDGGEDEGIGRAQKAIAPRGGTRAGLGATELRNRLFALSIHLLSTTAKLGIDSPFTRLFKTPRDLSRWVQMLPYGSTDNAAWNELETYGEDSLFGAMTFENAARLYSVPLPPMPEGNADETRATDNMTDAEVETANMMGERSIVVPAVAWWNVPATVTAQQQRGVQQQWWGTLSDEDWQNIQRHLARMEQRPSQPVNIIWSTVRYQDERRARAAATRSRLPTGHFEIVPDEDGFRIQVDRNDLPSDRTEAETPTQPE